MDDCRLGGFQLINTGQNFQPDGCVINPNDSWFGEFLDTGFYFKHKKLIDEINFYKTDNERLRGVIKGLEAEKTTQEANITSLNNQKSNLNNEISGLNTAIQKTDTEINSIKREITNSKPIVTPSQPSVPQGIRTNTRRGERCGPTTNSRCMAGECCSTHDWCGSGNDHCWVNSRKDTHYHGESVSKVTTLPPPPPPSPPPPPVFAYIYNGNPYIPGNVDNTSLIWYRNSGNSSKYWTGQGKPFWLCDSSPNNQGAKRTYEKIYNSSSYTDVYCKFHFNIDNTGKVYLNNTQIGTNNTWDRTVTVYGYLKYGNNRIHMEVTNLNPGGAGGCILSCVRNRDNTVLFITDSSWKMSPLHPTSTPPPPPPPPPPPGPTLIKHAQSGKCIDGNGSQLYFSPCQKANKYQNWTKVSGIDSLNFIMRHQGSDKCLDGNGESLYFSPCQSTNTYQNFSRDGGLLRHKQSGKCLDGNGNSFYFFPCQQNNTHQNWTEE